MALVAFEEWKRICVGIVDVRTRMNVGRDHVSKKR